MLFGTKIKELREYKHLPQREIANALNIDTATYCKIEKGDRKARREQLIIMANMFSVEENYLLSLWVADKVNDTISKDIEVAPLALCIVDNLLKEKGICQ
ncbi:MAG: helix-turn-helix transcriptional regulator [Rikenellaceae bacterium]